MKDGLGPEAFGRLAAALQAAWPAFPAERFLSRLPWGERVPALMGAPSPAWPLLERLRDDPSAYVRRSVANHWNDVAKDHPEAALDVLERWRADAPPPREKLVRHAARGLAKAGHPRALALDGVDAGSPLEVRDFGAHGPEGSSAEGPPRLMLGQTLAFGARLRNPGDRAVEVVADYAVHYRTANGTLSAKVFKGGRFRLAPGEARDWTKRHAFRAVTTRVHHPGPHRVTLQLNGRTATGFDLILDTPDGRPA